VVELRSIDPQEHIQQVVVSSGIKDQSNLFDENHLSNFLPLDINKISQHTLIDHDLSSKINEFCNYLASFYMTKIITIFHLKLMRVCNSLARFYMTKIMIKTSLLYMIWLMKIKRIQRTWL